MQELNPAPETSWREFAYGLAIVVLIGIVGWALLEQSPLATQALGSRYPIDYTEGLSLDRSLQAGTLARLYPLDLSVGPFRSTPQPPLFYALQSAMLRVEGLTLASGRMIAQISAIAAALFAGLSVFKLTRDISGTVAAVALLVMYPQFSTTALINAPEMLAFALALGGLCLAIWAPQHGVGGVAGLALAGLLFTAAAATDPIFVPPPLVAAIVFLVRQKRRRAAIGLAAGVIAACVLLLLLLDMMTQGGFSFNLLTASQRVYTRIRLLFFVLNMLVRSGLILITLVVFFVVEPLGERHRAAPIALAYLIAALPITALAGRDGTNASILLGLIGAISFSIGAMLGWLGRNRLVKAGIVVVVLLQISTLQEWRDTDFVPNLTRRVEVRRDMPRLIERMRAVDYNVLTDDYIALHVLAGKPPTVYPFEFSQLNAQGLWSDEAVVDAVRRKSFDMIIWYEPPDSLGEPFIIQRWTPAVRQAVYENYVSEGYLADALVYVPR